MNTTTWPNGKKVAVSVTLMFEAWSEDSAPNYSVQTTSLKKGTVDMAAKAWATYGGRVGVWRLLRMLERLGVPATFFCSGICANLYPRVVKAIADAGHDVAAHAYTQDQILSYMSLEEQQAVIRQCSELLSGRTGKPVTGWGSPAVAFTPETAGFLAEAGYKWTTDVTYVDLPIQLPTPHGPIAGVPTTDFSDNRVLKSNPRDWYDACRGTFDYLQQNEDMSLLVLVLHCQFGGRPLMTSVIQEFLSYVQKSSDVWFAQHRELADWALKAEIPEHTYPARYFPNVAATTTVHAATMAG